MAELGGGAKCLKYTLFFFNLLFFLLGFALFIIAIVVLVRTTTTRDAFDLHKYLIGYLVVSIIILVVAFLGCCGAIRESRCMLIMFIIFLSVVLVLCIAIQIALGVGLTYMENHVGNDLQHSTNNYTNNNDVRYMWDYLQHEFQCCGSYNYSDWQVPLGSDVPDSCCVNTTGQAALGCGKGMTLLPPSKANSTIYIGGCEDDLRSRLNFLALGALVVVGILIFLEVIGIILTCCLQRSIANSESYDRM